MADKMRLEPWQLACDSMIRSGRVTDGRLAAIAPRLMAQVAAGSWLRK